MLCLWTTSFTLIANFAPSGATGNRYYCEVNSAALLQAAAEEINNLTTNTTRENSAVIKLISDIEITGNLWLYSKSALYDDGEWLDEPSPLAFITLDLNGHVLHLNGTDVFALVTSYATELVIIDSNPTAANTLPNGTTVTGGAVYGTGTVAIMNYDRGYITINGGNFYGEMVMAALTNGTLTINQGVIACRGNRPGTELPSSIAVASTDSPKDGIFAGQVNINGGKITYPVDAMGEDVNDIITDPEIIAQHVTVDESKVNIIKDDAGNIIGYEEIKAVEPVDPEEPTEPSDPTDPTEQEPNDNKTPVLSGTTDNGQPTSDDFMKIMMIGVLVIVALSVISIAASLLVIKKYRPRVA